MSSVAFGILYLSLRYDPVNFLSVENLPFDDKRVECVSILLQHFIVCS